ncbi:MAG: hypothetical protein WCL22_06850, partial [bacterium]
MALLRSRHPALRQGESQSRVGYMIKPMVYPGDAMLLIPGVRIEKYENLNGDGQAFLKVNTQLHPRFQFTYDLAGDKSTKLEGSAGRYGVQIPTHLAVRGARRSTYTRQFFTYTG